MGLEAFARALFWNAQKWWATIKISLSKTTAYRLNFFLQIIGPALFFYFIKYNLWNSLYDYSGQEVMAGLSRQQMLDYHAWVLISSLLFKGVNSNNLSMDIRLGRISTYLIYPFNFWEYNSAAFIAFEILQFFICALFLILFVAFGAISPPSLEALLWGSCLSFLAGLLWFLIQYCLGLLAFWLEETWILRVAFELVANFLAATVVPLEMYPSWLVKIISYSPFPYLTYYPVKAFMGQNQVNVHDLGVLALWCLIIFALGQVLWKRGLRLYSGAGM